MKILHIIRDLSSATGGPVTAVRGMAEAQSALGQEVTIAATSLGASQELPKHFKVHMFPCQFHKWHWSRSMAKALAGLVSQADIVHLHMVWDFPVWAAAKSAIRYGKPFILRPCGNLDKWSLSQKAWKKRLYLRFLGVMVKKATATHFTTEGEWRNSLAEAHNRDPFIIPVGLPPIAYKNLPSSAVFFDKFPETSGRRIVLFLGRLHPKKQPDMAIRAFQQVCDVDDNLHLVLAGPGEKQYLHMLHGLVDSFGLGEKVTFTGMLQGDVLRTAYRAAYLFVLPSLQENFGIAVAEAMAAACPVVVSNKVDLSSEIERAQAGLVCSPDAKPTADAMGILLRDQTLRCAMGENARKLVLEKFTWDRVAHDLLEVYEDIISGQKKSLSWRN